MTQHFRPEAEAAKYRKSDSSAALAPVLGTSGALGHVLLTCKGYRAFDRKWQGTSQHVIWLDEEPDAFIYSEALTRIGTTDGSSS